MENEKFHFEKGDIIVNIPDGKAYMEVTKIIELLGYPIYDQHSISDFEEYPNIVHAGDVVCGGNSDFPAERKIDYYEFLLTVEVVKNVDTRDWREKLSEEFNKKIGRYDKQRMDS